MVRLQRLIEVHPLHNFLLLHFIPCLVVNAGFPYGRTQLQSQATGWSTGTAEKPAASQAAGPKTTISQK